MGRIEETFAELKKAKTHYPSVLVSFSGGRDSRCLLDICSRTFDHVEAYFMAFLPDLDYSKDQMAFAAKYGVKVHEVLHWATYRLLQQGVCRFPSNIFDNTPIVKLEAVKQYLRHKTGIKLIADGSKRADSMFKRRWMKMYQEHMVYPMVGRKKLDVYAYAKLHNIEFQNTESKIGAGSFGVGLEARNLKWIKENYPKDYDKICGFFPFAPADIYREEWYGH